MRICVGEEARSRKHFEDGRGVYIVPVRNPPRRCATKRKCTAADPFHSMFGFTYTIH